MADDRGQDIVEIVGDAAGKLADRLHLGRLRDLPLELGFLAIVLEQQQHGRITQPAQPGNGQRDRLRRLGVEADRQDRRTWPGPAHCGGRHRPPPLCLP